MANEMFIKADELELGPLLKRFSETQVHLTERLLVDISNFLNRYPIDNKDKEYKKLFAAFASKDEHSVWKLTPVEKQMAEQLFRLAVKRRLARLADPSLNPVERVNRLGIF